MMLIGLAWKNIWRNKVRSLVVIVAVMLGLWAGAFIFAYAAGMIDQRLDDAIRNEVSHFQVHHPKFDEDFEGRFFIGQKEELGVSLNNSQDIQIWTSRTITPCMAASAQNSLGARVFGIIPDIEDSVTHIAEKIAEGEYLSSNSRNKIVVGRKLAEKLKIGIRSKMVLTFQDTSGTIVAGAFRIIGIYELYNSAIEKTNVYVRQQDLANLMGIPGEVHEIAGLVNDQQNLTGVISNLKQAYPNLEIETWKEIRPELGIMIDSLDEYLVVFITIILLALAFGIVNTMLMAVLERFREIGMLMAIGMNKVRVFSLIFLETIMLVMIAVPLGLLAAYGSIEYFGTYGLDLSSIYAEGYAEFGFKSIIYPQLERIYYIRIMIMVAIAAVLSSIYPAITAVRLKPVEAIRKI